MIRPLVAAAACALLIGGCSPSGTGGSTRSSSDEGPAPKRQAGSWAQKFEVVSMSGKGADAAKAGMQQSLDALNAITVCVSPELAAAEDPSRGVLKFGAGGNGDDGCTYDEKDLTGSDISFSATCKGNDGKPIKIKAQGKLSPTMQDFSVTMSGQDTDGSPQDIQLKMHNTRKGDCGPGDIKLPAPGAK